MSESGQDRGLNPGVVEAEEERVLAVLSLLRSMGGAGYIGENVSQLQHALQAAHFAVESGAPREEVLAALLHDIGHGCAPADAPGMDGLGILDHEAIGAGYLRALGFSECVTALVEAHVHAKRYLVAKNAEYLARMSPASRRTLDFQGGPMSAQECRRFEADPLFRAKLRVRGWDERAKDPALRVAGLEAYREMISAELKRGAIE